MIFNTVLHILDSENREDTKFQFNWSINFRDIKFSINFNMQI